MLTPSKKEKRKKRENGGEEKKKEKIVELAHLFFPDLLLLRLC